MCFCIYLSKESTKKFLCIFLFLMEVQSVEGGFYRSGCCFEDYKAICQQIHQEIADVVRISEVRDGAWKGKRCDLELPKIRS